MDSAVLTPPKRQIRDFDGAMNYQNPVLVERFARRNEVPLEAAQHHFEETKKFIIVCGMLPDECSPSTKLDGMWHHFILHTKDYKNFCERYIGRFIHHNPTERPNIKSRAAMLELATTTFSSIDRVMWPSVEVVACSSACSGDDYCTDGGS